MTSNKSSRIVYLNGQFVPESEAKLSIYDLSVMQSAAAFEMTRSFNGEHFKLQEHLDRLVQSCDLLSIPWPVMTMSMLRECCQRVSEFNDHGPGEEHRLLIVVSPGAAPIYKEIEGTINHPFVYIADFPLRYTVQGFSKYFLEGVHCVTSQIQQVPDACIPSAAKHRARLHFHLAQQQSPAGTWPLLVSTDEGMEQYTEAPGANLVYVYGSDVGTIEENCLPGISLQTVKELTNAQSGGLFRNDITGISELWLTGTPFCMLPVVSLDGQPIGNGKIGPMYRETLAKWSQLVGVDIAAQICEWDAIPRAMYPRFAADKAFLKGTMWTPEQQRKMDAERTRTT